MNAVSQSGLENGGEERGAAAMPPRSPSAAATTPADSHLRLSGLSRSAGNPGTARQRRLKSRQIQEICIYTHTHTHTTSHRVGSFAFPAIWIESFLLLGQSLGLHGVHPPLLVLHLLPLVAQNDADGSGAGKQCRNKDSEGPIF